MSMSVGSISTYLETLSSNANKEVGYKCRCVSTNLTLLTLIQVINLSRRLLGKRLNSFNLNKMNLLYDVSIFLYVVSSLPYCLSEICCTPDVWKADVFLDYGLVAIDTKNDAPNTAYSYINGTMKLTYDYVNRRSYLKLQGTEVSPLLPVPGMPYDTTIINDYKKVKQFHFNSR